MTASTKTSTSTEPDQYQAARLDEDSRTRVRRALDALITAAEEMLAADEATVDVAADLARTHALLEKVFEATLTLRRESSWLRAVAVKNAAAIGWPYSRIGEAMGMIRQRVGQIAAEEKPEDKPLQVMSGDWLRDRRDDTFRFEKLKPVKGEMTRWDVFREEEHVGHVSRTTAGWKWQRLDGTTGEAESRFGAASQLVDEGS